MSFSFTWPATLVSCWGVRNPKNQNYYDAIKNHKSYTLFNSNQDPFLSKHGSRKVFQFLVTIVWFWWQIFMTKNITLIAFLSPTPNCWELIAKNVSMIIGFEQAFFNFKHFSLNMTIPSTFFLTDLHFFSSLDDTEWWTKKVVRSRIQLEIWNLEQGVTLAENCCDFL